MLGKVRIALVLGIIVGLVMVGCAPSGPTPEELARADQIRAVTEVTVTAASITAQNRVADATAVAPATAAVMAARVSSDVALAQATVEVSTARAGSDVTTAASKPTKDWMSFVLTLAIVGVLGVMLYWFAMRVRRASMRYAKTATGVVGVDEQGRLFNSSTMVESTITPATNQNDWLIQLERVQHYLMTGKVKYLPEAQKPLLTDGDATAEQRTRVATAALAEAMSSKISERERQERMALLRGRSTKSADGLLAGLGMPALASPVESQGQTNVTVIKPDADNPYLQLIAGAYGVPAKALADRSMQDATIIDQAWVASGKP